MDRREFLHRGGPLAGLACLGGCLGDATLDSPSATARTTRETAETPRETGEATREGGETTETAGTTTDDSSTTRDDGEEFHGVDSSDAEPFRTLSVGSREAVTFPESNRPCSVWVWNDADEDRDLRVRVNRDARERLDRTVEFDADAYLAVELNEPGDYRVAVGLGDDRPTTFRVRPARFDCNRSTTHVRVAPDGQVETAAFSTLMGCPAPSVAERDLSVGEAECGTDHSASVEFDGEQVRVEGAVRTPEPGYDLELADASYDREADELRVEVRASEDDLWGVQCIGEVPYEATVEFENALPGEVVVVHEVGDESEDVARTSR
ncbi:hypothetical protein [Halorussus halobius]|uniref:hypothetical protein n=1 Tax=Halorussus halobius TaxID=1710537 RepID=UPI001092863D|nr:hypothetical protein [Halorussus halobius]